MLYKKPEKLRNAGKRDRGSKWSEDSGFFCECPYPAFVG